MREHVDVLSVQYFCEPSVSKQLGVIASGPASLEKMIKDLAEWQAQVDKPVLVADIGNWCATEMNPHKTSGFASQKERGEDYVRSGRELAKLKWCVGCHWCGYIENKGGRGWGIVDPFDEPYREMTDEISRYNEEAIAVNRNVKMT